MKIGQRIMNNKVNIVCHNMENKTNKCNRCDMENPTTSKYCHGCGYELPNFIEKTNNQCKDLERADKEDYDKEIEIYKTHARKLRFVSILFFILLYFMTFIATLIFYNQFIPKGLGGLEYIFMLFASNFFILITTLIFSIIFVYKEKILFAFYAFALGVVLTLVVGFYILN